MLLMSMVAENRWVIVFSTKPAQAEGLKENGLVELKIKGDVINGKLIKLLRVEDDVELRREKRKGKRRVKCQLLVH